MTASMILPLENEVSLSNYLGSLQKEDRKITPEHLLSYFISAPKSD
jgi:hypothetical protein